MLWIFNYNKYILVKLWVKMFVSQEQMQEEIAAHTLSLKIISYL